jgi:alkylation response protein AidB-like acyl-CoA dehydrogenase
MTQSAGVAPFPSLPVVATGAVESPWFSEKGREIRDNVRALLPLIREDAREGERIGALTPRVLQALKDAGIYKMCMPKEWDGFALGARDLLEIISTLAEADGSAGWAAFVSIGLKNLLALDASVVEEVRSDTEDWVGPAVVGASVFATNVGRARRVDGGWMIEGRWAFGSGSKHARWAMVGIEYDPSTHPGSGRGVVVLPLPDYEIVDDWHVMGLSGTASNSLRVTQETFVPEHRFLDLMEYPQRFAAMHENYSGLAFQQRGTALLVAVAIADVAIALGMARGALACFAEQASKRQPFSLPYPTIGDMPSAQVAAGKALAIINLSAGALEGIADQVDARTSLGLDFTHEEESEIALTVAYAANLCEDAINLLQKTIGSSTVGLNNPIQRFVRDVRVLTSHGAIRLDPQAEVNGRRVLGLAPFPMFGGAVPERHAAPREGTRP